MISQIRIGHEAKVVEGLPSKLVISSPTPRYLGVVAYTYDGNTQQGEARGLDV